MNVTGRALIVAVTLTAGCTAKHDGTISGSLTSADGSPTPGTVYINYRLNGEMAEITVNVPASGRFQQTVAPKDYIVLAWAGDSRCGGEQDIKVGSGAHRTVDFVC